MTRDARTLPGSGLRTGLLAAALLAAAPAEAQVQAQVQAQAQAQAQAPAPAPPAAPQASPQPAPLDTYAEAATTTIIAEQSCPGLRLNAGQLTNLRLAARVAPAQEAALEEKLKGRAVEVRQRLNAEGRDAWCAAAFAAYGPAGTAAKAVLSREAPGRAGR